MKKRMHVKCGNWHLFGRKNQRGDFLPLLGTNARPLLVSAVGAVGSKLLQNLRKKYLEVEEREDHIEREEKE